VAVPVAVVVVIAVVGMTTGVTDATIGLLVGVVNVFASPTASPGGIHSPQAVVVRRAWLQAGDRFWTDRYFASARADFIAGGALTEGFSFAVFEVVFRVGQFGSSVPVTTAAVALTLDTDSPVTFDLIGCVVKIPLPSLGELLPTSFSATTPVIVSGVGLRSVT
jgi:hypothetical protein